jgi:transaldolase
VLRRPLGHRRGASLARVRNRLHALYEDFGQSPWLDNLKRGWLRNGELSQMVERGVRGITSNPTIFQKAIAGTDDYDEQWAQARAAGSSVDAAYWDLVVTDILDALDVLRPVHDASGGQDGFVSVEVDPGLANDTAGTVTAARELHARIDRPNLFVKVPATAEGVPAIRQLIGEGISINVTLIFSLARYGEVMDAYLGGLEAAPDPSKVSSVASFFVSRVDSEVDARLGLIGTPEAKALEGKAAIANAKLAYQRFLHKFAGPRWEALAARGARRQRPLWASTSTKNPAFPDTLYVDNLIGPDTVNTLPEATIDAFLDHGKLARTIDLDVEGAEADLARLARLGVDMDDVTRKLEVEGVASFSKSFDELLSTLAAKS